MVELIGEARGVHEEIWKIIKLITQLTMLGKEISIDRDRYEREGIKIGKKKIGGMILTYIFMGIESLVWYVLGEVWIKYHVLPIR